MQTVLFDKELNKKIKIITQQYEIGLYVAIYKEGESMPIQDGIDCEEKELHRNLRKNNSDYIKEESSIIEG